MSSPSVPVNTLWIGQSIGPIERACMRSFLRVGHPVRLFLYGPIDGVPEDVEIHDAKQILAESAIIRHLLGSFSLFSNYFRYKLQALGAGYWTDIDVYCLRRFEFSQPIVLGWQSEEICNGAVLRLPAGSELVNALLSVFEETRFPTWVPLRERFGFVLDTRQSVRFSLRTRLKSALRQNFSRAELTRRLPWGSAGPLAITHYVKRLGLTDCVQAREVFYPVPWQQAAWIFDPTTSLESIVKPNTCAIHLWNSILGQLKDKKPLPGSFVGRLYREGA